MADYDRNRGNQSYGNNQDWNHNRRRSGYTNDYDQARNQGNYNNPGRNANMQNTGYGSVYGGNVERRERETNQEQGNLRRRFSGQEGYRNDVNRNYNDRNYENTQYGTGGRYGNRNDYGQDYNQGGYSNFENRGNFENMGYGSNYGDQDWGNVNTGGYGAGYGRDYGNEYGNEYGRGYQNRDYGTAGGYGNVDYNRDRERNMYGGDTSNYGNANQGGYDRGWWDRTRDEVSSWFGDDDAERRRRMDRASGPHQGKGPKGYQRSDERIREDVCDRLSDNPVIDASNVEVRVEGSEVILTGTVESRGDKHRAEDIAESIAGVRNVQNQLRVNNT